MISLFFSFFGIIAGMVLAFIAPEELKAGHRYFLLLKRILFLVVWGVLSYYFFIFKSWGLIIFTLMGIILFLIDFKIKSLSFEIINYLFFIIIYFSEPNKTFQLVLASLIFLYGMPLGTLLEEKICLRKKMFKK